MWSTYNITLLCITLFISLRSVREIYMNTALKDVTPTSGILSYGEGIQKQSFTLSSKPDTEEEGKEVFDVVLLSTTGGATLSASDAHTTVAGNVA